MNIIEGKDIKYEYMKLDEDGNVQEAVHAVNGVDIEVKAGEFVAILGHNGSGKSTLAKHINALLVPTEGTLYVDGKDTKDETKLWEIRRSAGHGIPEPGQPDYRKYCGGGCGLRSGKSRRPHRGDLEAGR